MKFLAFTLVFLSSSWAFADDEAQAPASPTPPVVRQVVPSSDRRLDIGGAFGFNSPGGFNLKTGFGLTTDLRLFDHASVGLSVGSGLWGLRLTAHGRIYPLGVRRGLFLEGGIGGNTGGDVRYCSDAEAVDAFGECPVGERVEIELNPVGVFHGALGYRYDVKDRGWIAGQLGWLVPAHEPTFHLKPGATLTEAGETALKFARPGGPLIGISGGFSVL